MQVKVLGAGYGGVRAALDLSRRAGSGTDLSITLIDRNDYHQLITELHKSAAGSRRTEWLAIPLQDIFADSKVNLMQADIAGIDLSGKRVLLEDGVRVPYDQLVVAVGSRPEYFGIPGMEEYSLTIRSMNSALVIREHIETMFQEAAEMEDPGARRPYLTVVVAGGGLTGIEFAGELADRLPRLAARYGLPPREIRIITVEALPDILQGFDDVLVEKAVDALMVKGVVLKMGVPIVGVEPAAVVLEDGERLESHSIVWSGGVRGHELMERCFTTSGRGRAKVNEYLQSVDSPDVYCIGDCALAVHPESGQPMAPTAQHAMEQGKIAARNILARIRDRALTPYAGNTMGTVATIGQGEGIAHIGDRHLTGALAAVLKDATTWRYIHSLGGPRLMMQFFAAGTRRD